MSAIITGGICDDFVVQKQMGFNLCLTLWTSLSNISERRPLLSLPMIVKQVQEKAIEELSQAIEEKEEIYDRIIEQIHKAVQSHPSAQQYKAEAIEFLQVALKDCWQELEESTRHFLATGESVFRAFRNTKEMDFAATAVEFAKGLEVELNTKVINRFRSFLEKRGNLPQIIQETREQGGSRSKLLSAVYSKRELTLGQIKYALEEAVRSPFTIYDEFQEFLKQKVTTLSFGLMGISFPKSYE